MTVLSSLAQWKDLATIVGVAVALMVFIKGVLEYTNQGAQKRAEHFLAMRTRLKDDPVFKKICALVETDDSSLLEIPFAEKRDLLGLFEEVALMMNSKLIRPDVAHYMFGYYALRCWDSANFWSDVNRDSIYWALFRSFVEAMKKAEAALATESSRRLSTLRF
jgi:hypothetical protein